MKFITIIVFALWWGGFTFYAAWVIPTAHNVLGDKVVTGMITQQVSHILNGLNALFILSTLPPIFKKKILILIKYEVIILSIGTICLIGLLILHPFLDSFIKTDMQSLTDKTIFYNYHRAYLIISTANWICGLVWLYFYLKRVKN